MSLTQTFSSSARISFITCVLHLFMLIGLLYLGTADNDELETGLINRPLFSFRKADSILQSSFAAHREHTNLTMEPVEVCNERDRTWLSSVRYFVRHHSWPLQELQKPPIAVMKWNGVSSGFIKVDSIAELRQLIIKRVHEISRFAFTFARLAIRSTIYPEHPMSYVHTKDSIRCEIDHLSALRIHGDWYLSSGYKNNKKALWLADFKRKYVHQFYTVKDGSLVAILVRLSIIPGVGTAHKIVENVIRILTFLEPWKGTTGPSPFMRMALEKNPAWQEAFKEAERYRERAENSLTESNIAIRVLPLVLNILPMAAFAKNTAVMVIYAIVSDVISTVPLLSEGIKLVRIDRKRFVSVVTRMGDVSSNLNTTIPAEMWVAECRLEDNIGSVGIGFIVVSVGMVVLGITLEVVVSRWFKRAIEEDSDEK